MLSELSRLEPVNDNQREPRSIIGPVCLILMFGLILATTLPQVSWAKFQSLAGLANGAPEASPTGKSIMLDDPTFTALFESTQDEGMLPVATGDAAVAINTALPFSNAPIIAARPFFGVTADASVQDRALTCLTQAVYYEAGFEPEAGKRAVAQVVLNRMRHPAFPKSVCGVVYQGSDRRVCQFSFTCDGSLFRAPAPAAWSTAEAVARAALNGYIEPSVGYATHYHANYVSPYWAPKLSKLAQIGAHIFYRWPGSWGMPSAFQGRYAGMETIPVPRPAPTKTEIINGVEVQVAVAVANPNQPGDPTLELAKKTLPANLVPVRQADNDVGGRIDVSKGWTLSIPAPSESQGAISKIASNQAGGTELVVAESAAGSLP
jgi:spore germination cell wall hydrolase CwlJ-like protein